MKGRYPAVVGDWEGSWEAAQGWQGRAMALFPSLPGVGRGGAMALFPPLPRDGRVALWFYASPQVLLRTGTCYSSAAP